MRLSPLILAITAMATPAVFGQSSFDFGLQCGLAVPGGDVAKSASGSALAIGAQFRLTFRGGHAVVPRLDLVKFTGTRSFYDYSGGTYREVDADQSITSLGVDYNYYFSRKARQGFYLGGGIGFLEKKETYTLPAGYHWVDSPNQTKDRLYVSLGLGTALNRNINLFARFQFFGDERRDDEWNPRTGEYEARYDLSTITTFGVEFHF
jgi:hypothetical protein